MLCDKLAMAELKAASESHLDINIPRGCSKKTLAEILNDHSCKVNRCIQPITVLRILDIPKNEVHKTYHLCNGAIIDRTELQTFLGDTGQTMTPEHTTKRNISKCLFTHDECNPYWVDNSSPPNANTLYELIHLADSSKLEDTSSEYFKCRLPLAIVTRNMTVKQLRPLLLLHGLKPSVRMPVDSI